MDIIFLDFTKTFDQLDHSILLEKPIVFGLPPNYLHFVAAYLQNRLQFLEYHNFRSRRITVTTVVPQGLVLGPLLFLTFINDITLEINVNVLVYADDIKIYQTINNVGDSYDLQQALNLISNCCIKSNLALNANECNTFSFYRIKNPIISSYKLDKHILHTPEIVKDLGVVFDRRLAFDVHLARLISSANKTLGFVIRHTK